MQADALSPVFFSSCRLRARENGGRTLAPICLDWLWKRILRSCRRRCARIGAVRVEWDEFVGGEGLVEWDEFVRGEGLVEWDEFVRGGFS